MTMRSPAAPITSPAVTAGLEALAAACSQASSKLTAANGRVQMIFDPPFLLPPIVEAEVMALSGQPYAKALVSLDATQVTLQILNSALVAVPLIGLSVYVGLLPVGANIPVNITATKATQ